MLNRHRWQTRSLCSFIFLLAFIGVLLSRVPASLSQTRFADIQGHWAQPCLEGLTQQRIINGYADGTFRPNNPVTRAEYATLLVNAFPGVVNATRPSRDLQFRDVPQNYWAFGAIYQATIANFFSGYPDKTFRPNQNIPRVQALAVLPSYRAQKPAVETLSIFTDAQAIPAYAKDAIASAVEQRLVVNYPNIKQFNPNQPATRAEIATFLCRALPAMANLVPEQYVAGQPKTALSEIRGVWLTNIDSDVMFSRDRLTQTVQELADANLNTLYPAVWNWGFTLYPSQTAKQAIGVAYDPRPEAVGLTDRDMLKEFVEQGHQRKLSVIPWFEFGFMAPADSELARLHPDWLTQRSDKTQVWQEGKYPRVWLNPFKPEVQTFISSLILELVNNYDIEGIQFDDHFGLPFEFGYDDFTVALYQKENAGKSPPVDAQDRAWTKWRADKITAFMTQVFESIKSRKNHVLISLSPNNYDFSYTHSLQDWRDWEQKGLLEELILQVYRDSLEGFAEELMRPEVQTARSHIPTGVGILTGLKDRPVAFKQIQNQVQIVRDRQFAGVSFFFYETMWNLSGETVSDRRSAFAKLFSTPLYRPKFPPD